MIKGCLILVVSIINICAANESIVESDSATYIKIDSRLNPTTNTSYGSMQILDDISIKFNLIYHDNHHTSEQFENIFSIQSTTHNNDMNSNNDIHCTQYPSMWLSPNDNSLYFSLLNLYCLTPSQPIQPNIAYFINIGYNISHVYISINDIVIINDEYYLPTMDTTNIINSINLWISDSISNAACVTLYNISIETPIIISQLSSQYTVSGNAKHKDTIYIIEIAVLTVFCFACLGVIIASLCLLKMRQTSVQMKMIQGNCENKFVMSSHSEPGTIEISSIKRYTFDGDDDDDDMQLQEEKDAEEQELKNETYESNANSNSFKSNVTSQGRYYVQALRTARSKSENTPKYHDHTNQNQIPTYYSARNIFRSQKNNKKNHKNNDIVHQSTIPPIYYSANNIFTSQKKKNNKKNKKNNDIVHQANIPQTYYSTNNIFTSQKNKHNKNNDICIESLHDKKHDISHNSDPNDVLDLVNDIDAYDLNSDEGDEIKLRRAQIQSQRAVVSAFNLEMPLTSTTNQTLIIAESDDEDDNEEHTMDGLPVTHNKNMTNNNNNDNAQSTIANVNGSTDSTDSSHCSSSSIEDMFNNNSDITTPDQDDNNNNNIHINNTGIDSTIPPTFFNNDAQSTVPPTLPTTFFNIDHQSTIPPTFMNNDIQSTVPPTLPTTFFNIDHHSTIAPTLPTTFFNIDHQSTITPTFLNNDVQSTIPPTFAMHEAQSTVTVGPSIPSLATQITMENDHDEADNNDTSTDINHYSTMTNTTHLTSATKRYQLDALSDVNYNFSSSEDLNQLSSGDESTCITVPNTKRKSDTVSALSMVNSINHNISINYRRDLREYSSTAPNIALSKSITLSEHNNPLFEIEKGRNKSKMVVIDNNHMDQGNESSSTSSVIMGKIKRIKRVLSIGKSDDMAMIMSPSDSDTVSYQPNVGSLNSTDENFTLFPTYVMSDKIKHNYKNRKVESVQSKNTVTVSDSISYFNETKCQETSDGDSAVYDDEGSEVSYEWIKSALQNCDEDGWDKYYKNFKKHKVGDKRLTKLGDGDWRELIPDIGPRNDFKELWIVKQLNDDINHI